MNELRNIAHRLGYTLHHSGIYCKTASLIPTYNNVVSDRRFDINMEDISIGMREIEGILDDLIGEGLVKWNI